MTSKCGELNLGSLVRLNQTTYFFKNQSCLYIQDHIMSVKTKIVQTWYGTEPYFVLLFQRFLWEEIGTPDKMHKQFGTKRV